MTDVDWTLPIETGDGRPATVISRNTDSQGRGLYGVLADWKGTGEQRVMFFGAHGRWGDYSVRNTGKDI